MTERIKTYRWLLILAAVCTLAAIWLVAGRIVIEQKQDQVDPVIRYEDLSVLAERSGMSIDEWMRELASAGLRELILDADEFKDEAIFSRVENAGLQTAQLGGLARGGTYFFDARYELPAESEIAFDDLMQSEALNAESVLESILQSGSLLAAVDNGDQAGLVLPAGYSSSFSSYKGDVAKCFRLGLELSLRYRTLGYEGYEEIENILFRAVVDRGMTVLWLTPMRTPDGEMVTNLAEYAGLLRSLGERIASAGYRYGNPIGVPFRETPRLLVFVCGVGVISAALLLLALLIPLRLRRLIWLLFGLGMVQDLVFSFFFAQAQIALLALLAAIVFPCLSILLLTFWRTTAMRKAPLLLHYPAVLLSTFLVTLWGCVYIAGLLSSSSYLIALHMFRGVKLSQFSVYLFAILIPAAAVLHHRGASLRDDLGRMKAQIDRQFIRKAISVAVLLALVGTLYLLRTGHGTLEIPATEQRVRNCLENMLLFRPRTKEFLLAWPAIAAAVFFAARKDELLSWLSGVLGGIGYASVANTFCHGRAHVFVSIYRSFLGLGIGMVLGMIVLLFLLLCTAVVKAVHKSKPQAV